MLTHLRHPAITAPAAVALGLLLASTAQASSHREAPFITTAPKVDATDFYMFRSYESGRAGFVTLIANYQPLQDAYGGPNYFSLDPNALYEIHVDNDGDAREDITFQFRPNNQLANGSGVALRIGDQDVAIPLIQAGQVDAAGSASLNLRESYSVSVVRGGRRSGNAQPLSNASGGGASFIKPVDNIGTKTIPNYANYAAQHVYNVSIPGCSTAGRVFVGQRQESFAVNLGPIFDLVNAPLGTIANAGNSAATPNPLANKNITTLALEVPVSCLTNGNEPVIGGWTTASLRQGRLLNGAPPSGHQTSEKPGGAWTQVSRLGMPLVNEVVIGLKDKDKFNASKPEADGQFAAYVTNPTLPRLLEIAFNQSAGSLAPSNLPRTDLVTTFLTGIKGVNQPANVKASEMLRLNTAIAPRAFADQNRLGIVGEILEAGGAERLDPARDDLAGYPNGRRPKDDVVDISLIAVMGGLCVANGSAEARENKLGFGAECNAGAVPLGNGVFGLNDTVDQARSPFLERFPYLNTPVPGAGQGASQ